jgi:hypothetical protein
MPALLLAERAEPICPPDAAGTYDSNQSTKVDDRYSSQVQSGQ